MKVAWALLLCSVLLLTACGSGEQTLSDGGFIGGTNGLEMSWVTGAPPAMVQDAGQYDFSVALQLENVGESDVGRDAENSDNYYGSIELIGLDPAQFSNPVMFRTFDDDDISMQGKRRAGIDIIPGGTGVMYFEGFNYLPDVFGSQDHTLRANLCYDYMTYTNSKVCIKDNPNERVDDNSICTLAGAKDVKNSGAPLQVTSVQQRPAGKDKIGVSFVIENLGPGKVFRRSDQQTNRGYTPCYDPYAGNANYNKVWVKVSFPNDQYSNLIECKNLRGNFASNEGEVTMFEGTPATVDCTILTDPSKGRTYTSTLNIDLKYTYLRYIEMPLTVEDTSAGSTTRVN